MTNKIIEEFKVFEYNEEVKKIFQLQESKRRYQEHPTVTTEQELRDYCKQLRPQAVIDYLHQMMNSTDVTKHFLKEIFTAAAYGHRKWLAWSGVIIKDFIQAMAVEQVCLGVQINDIDKSRPTEDDMDFYRNFSMAKLDDVMDRLEEKWQKIEQDWSEAKNGLTRDVQIIMESLASKSEQEIADAIQLFQNGINCIATLFLKIMKNLEIM